MFARCVYVELRKSVDTRAARVLIGVLVVLGTGMALLASQSDPTLSDFVAAAVVPLPLLLPTIAILLITGDWAHRSAMTTFSLVPRRRNVLVARYLAAVVMVIVAMILVAGMAALAFILVHPGNLPRTDWSDLRETLWSIFAISLAAALSGIAMGALLLNTPLAIVVTMLVPLSYDLAFASRFPDVAPWVSSLAFSTWLTNPQWTWLAPSDLTTGLGSALCSLVLWTAIPLALGTLRQLRKEVA